GGISIKPADGMHHMKADMTGAASVIAAMGAIGALKPKVNVIAIAPCTENLPGGGATKPGDVFTSMSGKTVEVINTDAEGRLVLVRGLPHPHRQGPRAGGDDPRRARRGDESGRRRHVDRRDRDRARQPLQWPVRKAGHIRRGGP